MYSTLWRRFRLGTSYHIHSAALANQTDVPRLQLPDVEISMSFGQKSSENPVPPAADYPGLLWVSIDYVTVYLLVNVNAFSSSLALIGHGWPGNVQVIPH